MNTLYHTNIPSFGHDKKKLIDIISEDKRLVDILIHKIARHKLCIDLESYKFKVGTNNTYILKHR